MPPEKSSVTTKESSGLAKIMTSTVSSHNEWKGSCKFRNRERVHCITAVIDYKPNPDKRTQFSTPLRGISAFTKLFSARKTQKTISKLLMWSHTIPVDVMKKTGTRDNERVVHISHYNHRVI